MDSDPNSIEEALKELATEVRTGLDQHPTTDDLADYSLGRLSDRVEEGVREHVSICSDCAEILLDLSEDFGTQGEEASPELVAEVWEGVRAEFSKGKVTEAEAAEALASSSTIRLRPNAKSNPRKSFQLGLAAGIGIAVLAGLLWNQFQSSGGGDKTEAPQTYLSGTSIIPPLHLGVRGGGPNPTKTIEIDPKAPETVVPVPIEPELGVGLRIRLSTEAGTELDSQLAEADANGFFFFRVHRDLPIGRYRIELLGHPEVGRNEEILGSWPMVVRSP